MLDELRERLDDILDEDAPNKHVWKTHATLDEWLTQKVLPALRDCRAALPSGAEPVAWPGRKFCETAERNVAELAKWVKGKDDKQVASDAALAIRTLLASPQSSSQVTEEPPAVKLLRGALSQRATSAEFNEWQAREVVAYIDALAAAALSPVKGDGQ